MQLGIPVRLSRKQKDAKGHFGVAYHYDGLVGVAFRRGVSDAARCISCRCASTTGWWVLHFGAVFWMLHVAFGAVRLYDGLVGVAF